MLRLSAIAVCGALVAMSGPAGAEPAVAERLRVQAAYVTEVRSAQPRRHELFVSAVPELSLLWQGRGTIVNLTYALTGALYAPSGASEIANRLTLGSSFEVTRRTTLLLGATAMHSSVTSFLISQPAAGSTVGILPAAGNRFITAGAAQVITHELSPRVRLDQQTDANVTTMLAPSPPLDAFVFGAGFGLERVWRYDGVGVETRAVYAIVRAAPPVPTQRIVTIALGPRWRHDWSRSVSTLVTAGGTLVLRPGAGNEPVVVPSARGSLLYIVDDSSVDLTVGTGIVSSPLTGQVVHSHNATVRGTTPISQRARVYAGGSVGVQRASLVELTPTNADLRFDSVLADAEVTWVVSPVVQIFGRYQFLAQIGESNDVALNPSFTRDLFLVGVQLSSRPPIVTGNPRARGGSVTGPELVTRVPQRVDRSDTADGAAPHEEAPPPAEGAETRGTDPTPTRPSQPAEEE